MHKSLASVLIGILFSFSASASVQKGECVSTRNSSHEFTAYVFRNTLKSLRLQSENSGPRQILVNKVSGDVGENKSLYTLVSTGQWALVDNDFLDGQDGQIEISGEIFNCTY